MRGFVYRFLGDTKGPLVAFDSARVSLESAIRKNPEDHRLHVSLRIALAGLGRKQDANRTARRAAEIMSLFADAVDGAYPLVALAQIHTLPGDQASALDQIKSLLEMPAPKLLTVPLLRLDPIYNGLRNNS